MISLVRSSVPLGWPALNEHLDFIVYDANVTSTGSDEKGRDELVCKKKLKL